MMNKIIEVNEELLEQVNGGCGNDYESGMECISCGTELTLDCNMRFEYLGGILHMMLQCPNCGKWIQIN